MGKEASFSSYFNEFKIILDNVFNEIITVDYNNKIFFVNKAASILFGIDSKNSLGKDVNELIHNSQLSCFLSTKKEELKKPIIINNLNLILSIIPLNEDKAVAGSMLIFSNVTSNSELLHKLDEERNRSEILNTAIETAYDGMVIIDKQGVYGIFRNRQRRCYRQSCN